MKYPNVSHYIPRTKNTSASASCPCGELGKYKAVIQVNCMRGDDDVEWRCKAHRNSATVQVT